VENKQIFDLKQQLHQLCLAFVKQRIANAQQVIRFAQEGAGEETKSSAGDKYETSREMMQQEKNRAMGQLTEANKLMVALQHIGFKSQPVKVSEGSIVNTSKGNFYIAISAGALQVNDRQYFAVSAASPIGSKMMGLKAGDQFEMNGRQYVINQLF